MSIANAVTLKPVRSVSTSVIKDDSVIVFSFSGGALPSGVTYSGPTNLYVPQSDGSYELVTSGPLFSDEALYIPAGFSDRNGNKTFAGLTAGVIGSGGVMPTGHSVASSDGSFPLTVEVLGSGTDSDGLPYYDVAIDGTNSAGSTQYATLYLNTAKSASASEPVTWGCWVKDLDALSHGYMMQVVVTGDTDLDSGSYATDDITTETLLQFSGTLGGSATNIRQALVFEVPDTETLDVDIRIKCPQLINKLTLPLCIANGSSDSAIVVTSASCTADSVSIPPTVCLVMEVVAPNGVAGVADQYQPTIPRLFELASATLLTKLRCSMQSTIKKGRLAATTTGGFEQSAYTGAELNLNGELNKVCMSFGSSGLIIGLNGAAASSGAWTDFGLAENLSLLGILSVYDGSSSLLGGAVKSLTIYPNTEFSAAECQSRSAL